MYGISKKYIIIYYDNVTSVIFINRALGLLVNATIKTIKFSYQ